MADNEEFGSIPVHVIRRILSYGTKKQKAESVTRQDEPDSANNGSSQQATTTKESNPNVQ